MRHSDEEIERAAQRFEQLTEELEPDSVDVDYTDDLRDIAEVSAALQAHEGRLIQAVDSARSRGRSWNQIALALGSV